MKLYTRLATELGGHPGAAGGVFTDVFWYEGDGEGDFLACRGGRGTVGRVGTRESRLLDLEESVERVVRVATVGLEGGTRCGRLGEEVRAGQGGWWSGCL